MRYQEEGGKITIMVDSDWAGEINTRRSTSGGVILHGSHLITHWSKMQATIALSSGEAELNAAVKGVSEGIGIYELMKEWMIYPELEVNLKTDSSAAKGTLTRHGSGRIKHLTAKQLWVQEALKTYQIEVNKIGREFNSADLLTHQCSKTDFANHVKRLNLFRL